MSGLPPTVRAFIAVRIPNAIIERLTAFQEQLKADFPAVSWTRPEAMHVTLRFLGNIDSERLPELAERLDVVAREFAAFELELASAGSFGNRVLWAGIATGQEQLKQMAEAVRLSTKGLSAHDETREFNAHVTLGRMREPARGVSAIIRKHASPTFGSWKVDHFELLRSELSPKGARYTMRGSFTLG